MVTEAVQVALLQNAACKLVILSAVSVKQVMSQSDLIDGVAEARRLENPLSLLIRREGRERFVAIPIE